MKLIVTHLKAPWPSGVVVGDVVDMPEVPVWAVGKCKPAEADATQVFIVNPEEKPADEPKAQKGKAK